MGLSRALANWGPKTIKVIGYSYVLCGVSMGKSEMSRGVPQVDEFPKRGNRGGSDKKTLQTLMFGKHGFNPRILTRKETLTDGTAGDVFFFFRWDFRQKK